jgi:hypothetical protein
VVAALDSGHAKKEAKAYAAETVKAYRGHMAALARLSPLEIWHSRIDLEQELALLGNGALQRKLAGVIARARGANVAKDDNFPHLASGTDPKIVDKPDTIFHLDPNADIKHRLGVERVMAAYKKTLGPDRRKLLDRFVMKDVAFKVVGVGSVGTFCCVGLFLSGDNEPLFLQIKQAMHSALERLGGKLGYKGNQGRRVMEGQQMMQAASDIFLGYTQDDDTGRQFYVRTLKNRELGKISEIGEGGALSGYAHLCGRTLARAHARSGDPAAMAGYMGKSPVLDEAIASFAVAYAHQTAIDYAALVKAKKPAKAPAKTPAKGTKSVAKKVKAA